MGADGSAMDLNTHAIRTRTYLLAAVLIAIIGFNPFVRGVRVPLLGWIDLAIHEAGHLFFMWAPEDVMLAMGNGFQALVPLIIAVTFVLHERDLAGGAVGLAWCGAALQDASVYIADAPTRDLPLLGPEDSHDWWQLLGKHMALHRADEIARIVLTVGMLTFALGVIVLAVGWRYDGVWRTGEAGAIFLPWQRERSLALQARIAEQSALDEERAQRQAHGTGDDPPDERKSKIRVHW